MLEFSPADGLIFSDVRIGHVYSETLTLFNPLSGPVEIEIRPSSQRYIVSPQRIRIEAKKSADVRVQLRVTHFANKQRGLDGVRDVFRVTEKGRLFT